MRRERRQENQRRLRQAPPDIQVRIDELILHGFSAAQRYAIGDAVSSELETRLRESGVNAATSRDIPWLRAQTSPLAAGQKPLEVGAQVARAVHGVIPK
jgi:hypothetical protein